MGVYCSDVDGSDVRGCGVGGGIVTNELYFTGLAAVVIVCQIRRSTAIMVFFLLYTNDMAILCNLTIF